MTLAKLIDRDNQDTFDNLENIRSCIRWYRGQMGAKNRKRVCDKTYFTRSVFDISDIPPTYRTEYTPHIIGHESKKALVLCDLHIPYHEPDVLMEALNDGKKEKVDTIILNGDIADFYQISRFSKDPRRKSIKKELTAVKYFLRKLRNKFPKQTIIYKAGNHEERYVQFLRLNAKELLGIDEFELRFVLGLNDLGIEWVGEKRPIKYGKLNIIHGHEYRQTFIPVNPARSLWTKAQDNALCGHSHRSSHHQEKSINKEVRACWSVGCLCELHPEYAPLNNYGHGFAIISKDETGHFKVSNKTIINGEVY